MLCVLRRRHSSRSQRWFRGGCGPFSPGPAALIDYSLYLLIVTAFRAPPASSDPFIGTLADRGSLLWSLNHHNSLRRGLVMWYGEGPRGCCRTESALNCLSGAHPKDVAVSGTVSWLCLGTKPDR